MQPPTGAQRRVTARRCTSVNLSTMTSGPPPREALTLDGPAGRIEALLDTPPGPLAAAVAVVCHPHPQHQGTMLNKVVHTIGRALNELQDSRRAVQLPWRRRQRRRLCGRDR